jgi:hypothetical protein
MKKELLPEWAQTFRLDREDTVGLLATATNALDEIVKYLDLKQCSADDSLACQVFAARHTLRDIEYALETGKKPYMHHFPKAKAAKAGE